MTDFYDFNHYLTYLYYEMINSDTTCLTDINSDSISLLYECITNYLKGISKNDEILIKTSVTGRRNKDHEIRTSFLIDIIKFVREQFPGNKIFVCDGPAYETRLSNEYRRLGWYKAIRELNIDVLDLNYGKVIYIDGIWPVSETWIQSAKVINICKAKTHNRLGVTLASKNLIGTLSGSCLGYPKLYHHHRYLQKIIHSLIKCRSDMFNIIDGYLGIEGNGPMKGRIANSNFVILGSNAFLCDVRAMIEMGFHPAATQYAIIPIEPIRNLTVNNKFVNEYFCNIRKSSFNYLPSCFHSWMYKSLYYDERRLESIYSTLSEVTISNWSLP